ncbi:MAG: hypothetical protein ABR998_03735 [Gemmatimonadales bacterium]
MKLSVKGLAYAGAVLWGGCLFLMGILNLMFPKYGVAMLDMIRSVYPGYGAMSGLTGVIVGTLYALVDGAICGALLAWLYNQFAKPGASASA